MTQEITKQNEQRGKRRSAFRVELVLGALIVASLTGVPNGLEVLTLILPYAVGLIVGLRGFDAHYNPKRL